MLLDINSVKIILKIKLSANFMIFEIVETNGNILVYCWWIFAIKHVLKENLDQPLPKNVQAFPMPPKVSLYPFSVWLLLVSVVFLSHPGLSPVSIALPSSLLSSVLLCDGVAVCLSTQLLKDI